MADIIEKNISLNVRKDGQLLSQFRVSIIPKREAIINIIQGEGAEENYKIPAREKTFVKLLFLLGGVGLYSVVVNRKIGRRLRRGYKKQTGLRRFGRWLIDNGSYRRIKNEELEENIMILDDEIIVVGNESLFSKYFKSALPVGDMHIF